MCTSFGYASVIQHDDFIAVIDCTQPMRNENACPGLLLQDAVDVLE